MPARHSTRSFPMAGSSIPFPIIDMAPERWQWPSPPFNWRHLPPPPHDAVQPCRLETMRGSVIDGHMLDFDLPGSRVKFRAPDGSSGFVNFERVRRMTLIDPL